MQLLLRGYRVRGTVRDLSRPESFAYLSRLQNAAENLELVEANLMSPPSHKSWTDAFNGVEYVLHIASPFTYLFEDSKTEIIDPIIIGTQVEWIDYFLAMTIIVRQSSFIVKILQP